MNTLIRNAATAALATIVFSAVNAQVKVGGAATSTTKVTANTTKATNAATGATKAATGAVKTTTKAATGAVKTTTNAAVNASKSAKVNAAANSAFNTATTSTTTNGEVKVDANVEADGSKIKGKSAEVKEVVVTEAQSIKDKAQEERKEIKPGLNISNKTEANGTNEATVNGGEISTSGQTEVTSETSVKANGKAVKEKAVEAKEKTKEKAVEVKEKVKDTKKPSVKAEGKVEAKGKVAAGKQ